MSLHRPLNIFVPHCSELLTDHRPHGDGLISHALISRLAERGHELYIAASGAIEGKRRGSGERSTPATMRAPSAEDCA